jgi:molybdopterin-containing oxidoreductase family membrane subunit
VGCICDIYLFICFTIWWTGLLPDFAMLRDSDNAFNKRVYSILSFGWSGRAKDWQRFEEVSLVRRISYALVLSVHTIVSMDFATSDTWMAHYYIPFVLVVLCFQVCDGYTVIIMRKVSKLEAYITIQHIELMNIVIMITGSIVGVAYITELFIAWYSGVEYEQYAFLNRATGPYWWAYLMMIMFYLHSLCGLKN